MKVNYIIAAVDSDGNGYSIMEDIFGFRTSEGYTYLICGEGECLIQFDGNVTNCWKQGTDFQMPHFTSTISEFMESLREQGVLLPHETVTDLYTEEQIYADVIVKEEE